MTFEGGKESKQGRKRVNANATKRVSYLASVKKINSCPIGKTSQAEHVPQKDILVALYCSMEAGPFVPQCVICAVLDLLSTSVWLHNPLSFRKIHFTIWERHILDGGPNDHLLLGTWTAKVSRQNPSQGALTADFTWTSAKNPHPIELFVAQRGYTSVTFACERASQQCVM